MKEIKKIVLSKLRQEEGFGFHKLVYAEFSKLTQEKTIALLNAYQTAIDSFDVYLKQYKSSSLTLEITRLDEHRVVAYRGLSTQVKNMLNHFDAEKAEAARKINLILKNYGNPTQLPYIQKNGLLENLIQDLELPNILALLTLIDASDWFLELKKSNKLFIEVFAERNLEQSPKITGATAAARKQADLAYDDYVKNLNALVIVMGEDEFKEVIDAVNNLIDYQKGVLAARKTSNSQDREGKI